MLTCANCLLISDSLLSVVYQCVQVARAHQLQQLLSKSSAKGVPGSPTYNAFMQPATPQNSPIRRPGSPMVLAGAGSPAARGQHDPYKAVQRQLLADVDAVRKRQKAGGTHLILQQAHPAQVLRSSHAETSHSAVMVRSHRTLFAAQWFIAGQTCQPDLQQAPLAPGAVRSEP